MQTQLNFRECNIFRYVVTSISYRFFFLTTKMLSKCVSFFYSLCIDYFSSASEKSQVLGGNIFIISWFEK